MAVTITSNFQYNVAGDYTYQSGNFTESITSSTALVDSGVTALSTSITLLTALTVSVTSGLEGRLFLKNLDSTNFVTYGSTANLEFKLKATEISWQRVTPGTDVGFKAAVANTKVQWWLAAD